MAWRKLESKNPMLFGNWEKFFLEDFKERTFLGMRKKLSIWNLFLLAHRSSTYFDWKLQKEKLPNRR